MMELLIDGARYGGWAAVSVQRAVEQAASAFSLGVTERWPDGGDAWRITPGAECTLEIEGETVLSGFSDLFTAGLDGGRRDVGVQGRAKTADLIDSSAIHPDGQFRGLDAAGIARTLCAPFAIDVESEIDADAITDLQLQQGETCQDVLERMARQQGFLFGDTPAGALRLYRAGAVRADDALIEGENILRANIDLDASAVHSEYRVKGQQAWVPGLSGEDVAAPTSGRVVSSRPMRHRPLMLTAESQSHPAWAQKRAAWEARRRSARALSVSMTVQGWRQSTGALWRENSIVYVRSAALGLARDLLIAEIEYSLGPDGTLTRMRLTHREAFEPEPDQVRDQAGGRKAPRASEARARSSAKTDAIDWTDYYQEAAG